MDRDDCSCCGPNRDRSSTTAANTGQLLTETPPTVEPLPPRLQTGLAGFAETESVETLEEWGEVINSYLDADTVTVDTLCHTDAESEHWGEVDGERYDFACFFDAILLAGLVEQSVAVRTVSPDGTEITATATPAGDVTVSPIDAVFSFGIDHGVLEDSPDDPTLEDIYQYNCPYVRAFPTIEAYQSWAASTRAITVALPFDAVPALVDVILNEE